MSILALGNNQETRMKPRQYISFSMETRTELLIE